MLLTGNFEIFRVAMALKLPSIQFEAAEIRRRASGDAHNGKARHWQLVEHQAGAKPRLQQARGFLLGIDPDIGHAWKAARALNG